MDDVLRQHLDSVVRRVRARLATRRLVQGAVYGVVAGLGLAIPTVLVLTRVVPPSRLVLVGSLASAGLVATAVLIGASVSLLRRSLQRTEVAQLLDKALGTEEAWLTAQWLLDDTAAPRREELLQGLQARLESPAIAGMLRLRVPRAVRAVPVLLALLVGVFFLPPGLLATRHTASTPEGQEGERLAERLGEVEQEAKGAPLPDAIESGLDSLSDELAGEEITADEAVKRIEDLQEQLDRFTEEMKPTTDLLDELERAADELAASQPDLSEALRNADMDAAADALEDLAKQGGMTADEKKQLGERMSDAGEQLAGSQDPAMREAGEALKQAGQQLGQEGAQQASQQGGQQGGQQPMSAETQQRMEQLRDQIEKNRELGERLQQDQKALERAQRTNGALEASRQRLGGESDPRERGESSQGEGQEGTDGQGEGQDDGQGRQGAQGGQKGNDGAQGQAAGRGAAHTWEDEGEHDRGQGQHTDADRNNDRTASADQYVDDFERLYAPSRLEDVDALLAGAKGQLDENGQIEIVPTRRTGSDETAERVLVDVPDGYAKAAREAINDETVPPGYRDAVKQYFDQVE